MSIRELINEHSQRLLNADNLSPAEASQRRIELVALLGRINVECAEAEHAFKRLKLTCRTSETCKAAIDAKTTAEASQEYLNWLEKKAWQQTTLELIRSLRDFTRTLEQERLLTPKGEL